MRTRNGSPTPDEPQRSGRAAMRIEAGHIGVWIGGVVAPPLFVDVSPDRPIEVRAAGDSLRLYRVRYVSLGWLDAEGVGISDFEGRVEALLTADARAHFLLDVVTEPPKSWITAHAAELAFRTAEGRDIVSYSSKVWRADCAEALARVVRKVLRRAWGERCIGLQLSFGDDGDWPVYDSDAGGPMLQHWREFTVSKYRRNSEALRRGWDDPRAEFDRLRAPDRRDRTRGDLGVLRNATRSRRLLDWHEANAEARNEALVELAAAVKRVSKGALTVGAALPRMSPVGRNGGQRAGLLDPLFASDDLDFFVCSGGTDRAEPPTGSIDLHNKVVLYLAGETDPTIASTRAAVRGAGLVVFPDATTVARAERLMGQAHRNGLSRHETVSRVAVIVDTMAGAYTAETEPANELLGSLMEQQFRELASLGAPYDVYSIGDLFHASLPDYMVYVFVNILYLSEAERRRVDAKVKRSGNTAVWLWASGLGSETDVSAENSAKLIGQKLRVESGSTELQVKIVNTEDPLVRGFHRGATFGSRVALAPTVTVADRHSVRLGANSANKTVFAVRRYEHWTSVVCGTLPVPAAILRNILRAARCHLFLDSGREGDVVWADSRFVGLHSAQGGPLKLSLPAPSEVVDLESGQRVTEVSDLTIDMAPGSARCWSWHPVRHRQDPSRS